MIRCGFVCTDLIMINVKCEKANVIMIGMFTCDAGVFTADDCVFSSHDVMFSLVG